MNVCIAETIKDREPGY